MFAKRNAKEQFKEVDDAERASTTGRRRDSENDCEGRGTATKAIVRERRPSIRNDE